MNRISIATVLSSMTTAAVLLRRRRRRRRSRPSGRRALVRSIGCGSGRLARPRPLVASTTWRCSRAIPPMFYVAMATTGVCKTTNTGTTFTPVLRQRGQRLGRRRSRSRRPTRTSCGSAPARTTIARARRGATASTSRPMAAARGRTWACATPSRSRASSSTRRLQRRLRRVARRSVGGRRRARRLQDHRRRPDVEARRCIVDDDTGATELVMDPAQQQDALRRHLSAPPRSSGA